MKNLSPINDNKDVVTKEYVDPIKSQAAINRTTLGMQCKNQFDWKNANADASSNVTYTKTDTDITITSNGSWARIAYKLPALEIGTKYTFSAAVSDLSQAEATARIRIAYNFEGTNKIIDINLIKNGEYKADFTPTESTVYVLFYPNFSANTYTNSFTASDIMLCYADITDDTYEEYHETVDERILENKSDIVINKSTLGYQRKNQLNETGYLSSITSVTRGTKSISGNQITLTATAADCYTKPNADSDGGFRISVEPNTDYILSWESDNSNSGNVYIFMNGTTDGRKSANNNGSKTLKFTTNSDTTFITIRLGVSNSGDSITYSNIMLRYADILDDTYEAYQPSVQEQTAYSISVSGKSTSSAISYSGVPTLICLTPNTADSTAGGLYMINSAGAVVKLIDKSGVVIAADATSKTFTITNNTTTVMDVCVSRCWGR